MKKYESYKDSGVEWIGEVPIHWKVVPLKFTGTFGNGLTYSPNDIVEDGVLVLRSSNIQNSELSFDDNVYVSHVPQNLLVNKGDIIICSRNGSAALVGKCAFIKEDINATFGAFMMRYIPKIENRYGFYLFQTAIGRYKGYFATTTINQLTKSTIGEMKVPVADINEQDTIATYLDKKCSEIDKVISTQQKRITLLQELKQSVITHAVTKGLNPNVEMKDSGVEWIGEVPKHWEIMKTSLAFLGIGSGTTPSTSKPEYYDDDGRYWLQTGDLNDGIIVETNKKVTELAVEACNLKFYPVDSVVIAMYGATIGKVGMLGIETATNQACCVLPKTKRMDAKYAFYEYIACKPALLVSAIGGGQPNISQDTIKKQKIAVPPLSEQHSIASYLDKKCASIDSSISKAQHQVDLLQEYKQSLITEVVTGKRKVC